jgi:hypothetical protein
MRIPERVKIGGQECPVINNATFSGVLHYGIIFTMLRQHQHPSPNDPARIVTESIGWVPATLCEEVPPQPMVPLGYFDNEGNQRTKI